MERRGLLPGWLLPVGLGVLVVGLVAIALLRGPVELDPESPEGTVQEYLLALNEERWEDAVSVIHSRWLGDCDGGDLERFTPDTEFSARLGRPTGAGGFIEERFEEMTPPDEEPLPQGETTVEVTITRMEPGDFASRWDEYVRFELIEEDDFWWLVNDPWPYFVWSCRET